MIIRRQKLAFKSPQLLRNVTNRDAFWSLIITRVIYSINWYNIASVFSQVAFDFKTDVSGLGLLTSSFFLGVGLFQLPGGVMAARYGPRKTSFLGILIASTGVLLTSFSTEILHLAVLRFFVGLGMSFFFAPGVTLVVRYFRSGAEGLGIGLYNSAFDVGGAIGLFGWAVLGELIGWRESLLVSGALGVFTSVLMLLFLPKENKTEGFKLKLDQLRGVLLERELILVSLGILGLGIGSTLVGNFMVFYLERKIGLSAGFAGSIGALVLFIPIFFSPVGGRIFDELRNTRGLMLLSGVTMALGVGFAEFEGVYGAILATCVVGLAASLGFTVGFAAARETNRSIPAYESLAVAWANSISLFGGFWAPVVFSSIASNFGYPLAWLTGGGMSLIFVLPITLLSRPRVRAVQ